MNLGHTFRLLLLVAGHSGLIPHHVWSSVTIAGFCPPCLNLVGLCPGWGVHSPTLDHPLCPLVFHHGETPFLLLPENIKPATTLTSWLHDSEFFESCMSSPLWYKCIFCTKNKEKTHLQFLLCFHEFTVVKIQTFSLFCYVSYLHLIKLYLQWPLGAHANH